LERVKELSLSSGASPDHLAELPRVPARLGGRLVLAALEIAFGAAGVEEMRADADDCGRVSVAVQTE
jgi:hypothetical protein